MRPISNPLLRPALACAFVLFGHAAAQHATMPSTVSGTYDMTTWTPIPIGTCTGTGAGCTTVYGFDWLSDGRMVIFTNDYIGQDQKPFNRPRAKVSIITNPGTSAATVQTIASHFKQPAGVAVVNDRIWVSDMDTIYTIPNNNPAPADTITNRTRRFATPLSTDYNGHLPPTSFAYNKGTCSGFPTGACNNTNSQAHHYVFTPVFYQGKFYASYGDATGSGTGLANLNSSSFYGGALLVWDSTTTQLDTIANRSFAGGFRSPNGTALGPNGSIFVSDHQGSYIPMETITMFKVGAPRMQYGGYRLNPGFTPNFAQAWYDRGQADYVPPLAIHRYNRSQKAGWVGIGQPFYLTQGPYAGQLLVGCVNSRGLWRVALDTLPDTTGAMTVQGTVLSFTPGNATNTLGTGTAALHRITQGPDGTIYAGGGRGVGNWATGPSQHLIYVFKPKANPNQFEIMNVRSLVDGYELYLSQKVNPATVTPAKFQVGQRNWVRQSAYGLGFSPNNSGGTTDGEPNFLNRPITSVTISDDSLRIRLVVPGIQRINQQRRGDSVTHWHTRFLFDSSLASVTGAKLYTTEADYAQNWISTRTWNGGGTPLSVARPVHSVLSDRVWFTRAPGVVRVHADRIAAYEAVLMDLRGRVVDRKQGSAGTTVEFAAPSATQGVYSIEIRSGAESFRKVVTF